MYPKKKIQQHGFRFHLGEFQTKSCYIFREPALDFQKTKSTCLAITNDPYITFILHGQEFMYRPKTLVCSYVPHMVPAKDPYIQVRVLKT